MTSTPYRLPLVARPRNLHYTTPELVFERIEIDATCAVLVFGGDGEGSYEWAIEKNGAIEQHSDKGYGLSFAALRDGLMECWPPNGALRSANSNATQGTADVLLAASQLETECLRIVLSAVAAKANIETDDLIAMLDEAKERLTHKGDRAQ